MRHDTDRCDPADLQPYPDLVDFCALKDWRVGLAHTKTGWTLEVRENGELLAKRFSSPWAAIARACANPTGSSPS
jgi:hypothetical protein